MSTDPLNAMVRHHKAALTRAKNSGKPEAIIAACDAAFAEFDRTTYPDNWSLWQRARDDATMKLLREETA